MQLTKKATNSDPKEQKAPQSVDWSIMEIDYTIPMPRGKWEGYTLSEVKQQDESYYKWMLAEDMIEKWALYRVKSTAMKVKKAKPQWDPLVTSTGDIWMGIRICEGDGVPYEE